MLDLTYEVRCQSDSLRLLRHSKVYGFTLNPVTENQIALLLSDSRTVIMDVMATEYSKPEVSLHGFSRKLKYNDFYITLFSFVL